MSRHVTVLPDDVLHSLMAQLNGQSPYHEPHHEGLRFLRLPHPRSGIPALFLPCRVPESGKTSILEVQMVSPPNSRSWLMSEGEVFDDGQMLMMTSIDPAFLLIPILSSTSSTDGSVGTFRLAEDLFEEAVTKWKERFSSTSLKEGPSAAPIQDILHLLSFDCVHSAMKRICEVKDVSTEIVVYRYTAQKAMQYLKTKTSRLAGQEICEISRTMIRNMAKDGLMEDGKERLLGIARIRAACDLVSQYLSQDLSTELFSAYDFSELNAYYQANQDALAEATLEEKPQAKTKKGESKNTEVSGTKRKSQAKTTSNGVEKLKKANVKGMAKISSFFQKPSTG